MSGHRSGLVSIALAAMVAGCGSDGSGSVGAEPDSTDGSSTSLSIVVAAGGGAAPASYSLNCKPPGGDHPQPAQACEVLDKAGVGVFDPVPKDKACSMLFGGPQVATVKGTYDGAKVDATFKRSNGCEIDRWDTLGTTFFDVPML